MADKNTTISFVTVAKFKSVVKGLEPGVYTLTELTAPKGYVVAESITFTLTDEGKVFIGKTECENSEVVMIDDYEEVPPEVAADTKKPVVDKADRPKTSKTTSDNTSRKTVLTATGEKTTLVAYAVGAFSVAAVVAAAAFILKKKEEKAEK